MKSLFMLLILKSVAVPMQRRTDFMKYSKENSDECTYKLHFFKSHGSLICQKSAFILHIHNIHKYHYYLPATKDIIALKHAYA